MLQVRFVFSCVLNNFPNSLSQVCHTPAVCSEYNNSIVECDKPVDRVHMREIEGERLNAGFLAATV